VTAPPDDDSIPHQSLWALIPRRSLVKVAFLLALLLVIVFFQRRAELVARHMTGALAPATPSPSPVTPPASRSPSPATPTQSGRP
jgi:hypothetical protein